MVKRSDTAARGGPGGRGRKADGRGKAAGLFWSVAAHAALLGIVMLGGIVIPQSPPPAEMGIKATVVDPDTLAAVRQPPDDQARLAAEREREQERALEETRRDEERRRAETADAARAAEDAETRAKAEVAAEATRQAEAQAAAAQAQAEAEAKAEAKARAEAKAKAEAKAQAEAKAKAERERAEAARKAAAAKREREEAAKREAEAARQRAVQADMARQLAAEEQRFAAVESGALAEYVALIRQRVERNWVRPPSARAGIECEVLVTQIPGGEVIGVRMGACNGDDAVRRSIEAAVMRASPLPPPDDVSLFERNLRFVFKPEE